LNLLGLLGLHNENRLTAGGEAHVAAILFEHGGLVDYVPGPDDALKLPLMVDLPFITRSDGIGHSASPPAMTDVVGVLNRRLDLPVIPRGTQVIQSTKET
jgi:hypothetical protein